MAGFVRRLFGPNPPIPTPQSPSPLPVHIRWMIERDQLYVLSIEHASFDFPWGESDFRRVMRLRNRDGLFSVIAMVAETEDTPSGAFIAMKTGQPGQPGRGKIAGFMVYELRPSRIDLLNFAVHPRFRRRRVGAEMIAKLASKLSPAGRRSIRADVRETNVAAQLFFRACGFAATKTVRGAYDDTEEDMYRMVYRPCGPGCGPGCESGDSPRRHGGDQHG